LKQLQRKLAGTQKGSRNREKIQFLLRKEYEKLNNRRKDAQNKVLAFSEDIPEGSISIETVSIEEQTYTICGYLDSDLHMDKIKLHFSNRDLMLL